MDATRLSHLHSSKQCLKIGGHYKAIKQRPTPLHSRSSQLHVHVSLRELSRSKLRFAAMLLRYKRQPVRVAFVRLPLALLLEQNNPRVIGSMFQGPLDELGGHEIFDADAMAEHLVGDLVVRRGLEDTSHIQDVGRLLPAKLLAIFGGRPFSDVFFVAGFFEFGHGAHLGEVDAAVLYRSRRKTRRRTIRRKSRRILEARCIHHGPTAAGLGEADDEVVVIVVIFVLLLAAGEESGHLVVVGVVLGY